MASSLRNSKKAHSRRGRPKKLDQALIDKIVNAFEELKASSWEELAHTFGIDNVHLQTLRNNVTNEGYCKSMGCHGLWLTMEARQARLEFAGYYQNWGSEWRSAVFISCVEIELKANHAIKVHVDDKQQFCTRCLQNRTNKRKETLLYWTGVGFNQESKFALTHKRNEVPITLIEGILFSGKGFIRKPLLLREGRNMSLSKNNIAIPQSFDRSLEDLGMTIIRLPPCSSELNLAKDVLLHLKKNIQKCSCGSADDLTHIVSIEGDKISMRCINKLVDLMPSRISRVTLRGGKPA
ncbi:hypothetical protein N7450_011557 [Penicillium hetheringtonii]|uniref:Tc1-like transposase DDE domain-containing protein n=1 Tax=Penicillium hetheringtonii TaxID=911720 RepID=A0AAD6DAF6_9EURO|nr:hypothetical protein N7450_011557 [Penicillium hetheringtonii]